MSLVSGIDRSAMCSLTQEILLKEYASVVQDRLAPCPLCSVAVGFHVLGASSVPTDLLKGLSLASTGGNNGRTVDVPKWKSGEGTSVIPFLERFEQLCRAEGVNESRWPALLLKSVTHPAEAGWVNKEIVVAGLDWEQAKAKFFKHFEKTEYLEELERDYHQCRQGKSESVQLYADRFRQLC